MWGGVTTVCETLLKGRNIRKAANHCSRERERERESEQDWTHIHTDTQTHTRTHNICIAALDALKLAK